MLFYLAQSLVVDSADKEFSAIFDAVRNLSSSAVHGKHMVYADYDTILHFEKCFENDPVIFQFYHLLRVNYSTTIIPVFLSYYIRVVKGSPTSYKLEDKVGEISYSVFLDFDAASQCSLIAENDNDCVFYRYILSWYIKNHYPNQVIWTSFNDVNGSGGETPSAIKKELEKNHVSVCIVDRDVKYPGDSPSKESTCSKCRRVNKVLPFYKYKELDVHEIENLIPINYLLMVDGWKGDAAQKKKAFEKICDNSQIMRYFDIKQGVHRASEPTGALFEFGRLCYESNPDYLSESTYLEKYASGCAVVYPGLIERALKKTIDLLSNEHLDPPQLLDFQLSNWNEIGSILLNYGIAKNSETVY